jgi:hypothetical protein
MKKKLMLVWSMLVVVLGTVGTYAAVDDDDDPPCHASTNAVITVRVPQDLTLNTNAPSGTFLYYSITNPGNYRFMVDRDKVYQVVNSFPFDIPIFAMGEGEAWDFYLPCNYQPYNITFVDVTRHYIPVGRMKLGIYEVFTAGQVTTNTHWQHINTIVNYKSNAVARAPFYRAEKMRFYKLRQMEE